LTQHPAAACYLTLKQHYVAWVLDTGRQVGDAYMKWSRLWPTNDALLLADLRAAMSKLDDGTVKYANELTFPSSTCTKPISPPSSGG
jgi:hypothetical protein